MSVRKLLMWKDYWRNTKLSAIRFTLSLVKSVKLFVWYQKNILHTWSLIIVNQTNIFFCETCGNKFANQYILKTHMTRHESEIQTLKKTIFTCEECGQNLCSKKSVLRHKIAAHSKDYPFQCTLCLKGFTSELRKKICEDNHNGVFKYVCTQCDFKSNQSDKFRAHMNTHSKENCYTCPCCGKISLTTKNLGLHTKQVHGKTLCEAEIFSKKDRLGRNLTDSQVMKIQLKINKQWGKNCRNHQIICLDLKLDWDSHLTLLGTNFQSDLYKTEDNLDKKFNEKERKTPYLLDLLDINGLWSYYY